MSSASSPRIAIIGGGISGLAAAHRLRELDPAAQVTLFEASDQLGGILRTIRRKGFLIERSADSFIINVPWATDLCRRVGLENQLQPTTGDRRVFVVRQGKLLEVPSGFSLMAPARIWPMLTTPILSPWGKLRMGWEYFVPRRKMRDGTSDESLAAFVRRRWGKEVFDRLVQPLIGGIYTADPDQLSLAATMPRFLEMEKKYGSLIRGGRRLSATDSSGDLASSGARYSLFVTLGEGMSSLVEAIAARLAPDSIRLNSPVERILSLPDKSWQIFVRSENTPQVFTAIVLALPSHRAAQLLVPVQATLASELAAIPHASSAVVCVGYRREQIRQPLAGFGFVVPRIENRSILSVSYASQKFAGRAPAGTVLLRVFFGGAMQPEMAGKNDAELLALTQHELGELLGLQGEPIVQEIVRWPEAMPQFHLGHVERIGRIAELSHQLPNFALAANAFQGVGIPHCIHSGECAAEYLSQRLVIDKRVSA